MADPVVTSHHARVPQADPEQTVTFTLDGRPVDAARGELLIAAAERVGTFIPRFCYHPRLAPVGMCRMCLVEVSSPRGPSLQPACYLAVSDGMEVVTTSERVRKAQDGVLELLLVNHPLDCPVCDKGGECPLQDQVLSYGPGESRFVEEKRHWAKPIPISDLVLLDRERCIQCGRCVRFAAEVAGEAQIDLQGRGDRVEVNIFEHQPFDSVFSGNTVQICPVGALTAVPYRFTARPWDVDQVESTCTTCSVGCRVAVQSSSNRVTRLLGIDSDPVNQSWLCDKGRFVATAGGSPDRLVEPLVRGSSGELEPATWDAALGRVAERLRRVRSERGSTAIGLIGGARLSNEDAYVWARLAKGVLGTDSVDCQLGDGLPAELVLGLPRATIDQAASARALVVLAGDLRQELPVLFLRLRSAVVDREVPLVELGPVPSALGRLGCHLTVRPGEAVDVVRALVGDGQGSLPEGTDASQLAAARRLLEAAGEDGEGVVVVVGRPSMAEAAGVPAAAARVLAAAWPKARFLPALRRGNVHGALDMGLAPGVLPGRVSLDAGRAWFEAAWGSVPAERGRDAMGVLAGLADGELEALILLGADPLGDAPDRALAERALERAPFVVAVDSFLSPSAARADVVLPVATAHERAGSMTNLEGRVTRLAAKVVAPGRCFTDWMVAVELAARLGEALPLASVADITDEIERTAPAYRGVGRLVLDGPAGRDGVVVPVGASPVELRRRSPAPIDPMATPGIESVELQGAPPRAGWAEPLGGSDDEQVAAAGPEPSGAATTAGLSRPAIITGVPEVEPPPAAPADGYGLRLVAERRLYDDGVAVDVVGALAGLVAPPTVRLNPADLATVVAEGAPAPAVRLRSPVGELELPAAADPLVPRGVAVVPFGVSTAEGASAAQLIGADHTVTWVRLEGARP
jgi:NADH-quinone oxidoreductase subunit G